LVLAVIIRAAMGNGRVHPLNPLPFVSPSYAYYTAHTINVPDLLL